MYNDDLEAHADPRIMIARLERLVEGNVPLPSGWPNSYYLYADDYYRRMQGLPLRRMAAGQYYLDEDKNGIERTLPYDSNRSSGRPTVA